MDGRGTEGSIVESLRHFAIVGRLTNNAEYLAVVGRLTNYFEYRNH